MDFSTLSIGQKIGIESKNGWGQESFYQVFPVEGETAKFWIVNGDYFRKTDGKKRGVDGVWLIPYDDAVKEILAKRKRREQEQFQAIAQTLKCQFSESFVSDLKQLIEKHRC